MQIRSDIQIIRGLAVLLVVLFHLGLPLFSHGFLGVDAFFVISGFLMALLYKPGNARTFYQRRASRLLPAYFVTIIATVIASALITLPSEQTQVVKQGLYAAVFASNIGFWQQNSYFSKAEFTPLLHLWSLGVEIQFYLIVPLLFWFHARSRILLPLLALGSLGADLVLVSVSPKTAFFLLPFRIWQFLAGAAVARYLSQNGAVRFSRPVAGAFALVILLLVAVAFPVNGESISPVYGHPALGAILVTLATAGVLACGLPQVLEQSALGVMLHKLGDWSYSVYLAHFPVIVLALYVPFAGTILTPSGPVQTLAIVAAIALVSAALYVLCDRRRIRISNVQTVGAMVGLTIIVTLLTGSLSRMQYSAQELNILDAFGDRGPFRCGILNRVVNRQAQFCELTEGLPATAPAVLFLGDSHADALKTSVATVAQEQGVRLFFTVANDPLIGRLGSSQILAEAEARGVHGVLVHFSSGNADLALATGFVDDAHQAGLDVAWLLPVPTYAQSVPALLWDARNTAPHSAIEPGNGAAISHLEDQLLEQGIPIYDPRPVLCPASCVLMDGQQHPFYFDSGHLSLTGARQLEGLFGEILNWFKQENGA